VQELILVLLLGMLAVTALAILRIAGLFTAAMLSGIYSLISAVIFVVLDAVDVAFTEAVVGAGVSTILMLAALALTHERRARPTPTSYPALLAVCTTGAALIYATVDMPLLGDPLAPANLHVVPRYIMQSGEEVGVPNIVTSVLASYRGFDTFGEVTVIFTAGIGVLALLGRGRPYGSEQTSGSEKEDA
jgi:multicomponent Na+:H+ antiporter subunit B